MSNYLFPIRDEGGGEENEKPIIHGHAPTEKDMPGMTCYQNGYHPSRWELAQVFLNGIWKPSKFKSILQYKNRTRLDLKLNDTCSDATLWHQNKNENVTLYDLMKQNGGKPLVLMCGSFT
ncbi:hypothetical protein CYY_004161 [Polysphondylium violaceum]|uniref:Uncharacterized protein n=1 Tax=Polysphondylium violaceum TaxID=133409 RepID=A0A8J4V809_9MYCE|nr:hypothetical protein CYY_004161 [Polysphondylium violaceum]